MIELLALSETGKQIQQSILTNRAN